MTSRPTALLALCALPLAACDSQSDGGYMGEPLVTMTGTVHNAGIPAPAGVDLATIVQQGVSTWTANVAA